MKMKRFLALALTVCMVLALCACGNSNTETKTEEKKTDDKVYELDISHHDPESSAAGTFLTNWANAVTEASDGRLKFTIHHGGTLGGVKETINLVTEGVVDIGWGGQSTYAGMFPLSLVMALPMTGMSTSVEASELFWTLYENNKDIQAEYEDYKVLLLHNNCSAPLAFSRKEVTSVDEMKGLNIRANSGPPAKYMEALGGAAISVAMGELYSALQNNTVDGVLTDWSGLYSFKLYEAVKYIIDEPIYYNCFYFLMNKDSYNSLPEDLQEIINEYSGWGALEVAGDNWDNYETLSREEIAKAGTATMIELSDSDKELFRQAADKVAADWIAEQEALGLDGQGVYDQLMELIAARG